MGLARLLLIAAVSILAACGPGKDQKTATKSHETVVAEASALLENSKCFETAKLSRARSMLNTALAASGPAYVQARIYLARYHLLAGSNCTMSVKDLPLRMAENELRLALASDPKSAEAFSVLGRVMTHNGRYQEALDALRQAERYGAQQPELNTNFALIHIAMKDWGKAAERLDRVPVCGAPASSSPGCDDKLAAAARIELYTATNDRSALLRAYRQSVDAFPDSAFMHGNYADYLIRSVGDADAAIVEADKALAIRAYPKVQRTMALALYAKWAQALAKDPVAARRYRQRAESFVPEAETLAAGVGCGIAGNQILQALQKAWKAEGISIDAQDGDGNTALISAVSCGSTKDVRWLLEHGASVNLGNAFGATALSIAAENGDEDKIEMLISKRAKVNIEDRNGNTPLMQAAAAGDTRITEKLLRAKANVNSINLKGETALMHAVGSGSEELVRLLLAAGADTELRSAEGPRMDAAELADAGKHHEIAALIKSYRH